MPIYHLEVVPACVHNMYLECMSISMNPPRLNPYFYYFNTLGLSLFNY